MKKILLFSILFFVWGCASQSNVDTDTGQDIRIQTDEFDSRTGDAPKDTSEDTGKTVDAEVTQDSGPDCADGILVMQAPCQARFKCAGPDKFVTLSTVTCLEMGLAPACCKGVGCKEGQKEPCPAHEVCTIALKDAPDDPCELRPGKIIDAKHPLILQIPNEAGEMVFEATASAWYADFSVSGNEGAALRVAGPDKVARYMAIPGGIGIPIRMALGPATSGNITVSVDADLAVDTPVWLTNARLRVLRPTDTEYEAFRHVPYFMGDKARFLSDVPLALTFDAKGGTRFEYTLFYSNEDSGYGSLPTLILAVWGRTLDIEWAAGVSGDNESGRKANFQTEGHGNKAFEGDWQGMHPILYMANAHGTFSETGKETIMFAPGLWKMPDARPREVFLDDQPWMIDVSNREMFREHKMLGSTPTPNKLQAPDLRHVLYIDINASMNGHKLNLKLDLNKKTSTLDAGLGEQAMMGSSGPKRVAMAFPTDATTDDLRKNGRLQACLQGNDSGQATIHSLTAFALDKTFKRIETPVFSVDKDIVLTTGKCVDLR